MEPDFMGVTCEAFADRLASRESIPGGGGASAYAGALGAALSQMVCKFTEGKQEYADVQGDVKRIDGEAERIRERLMELVDADALAFGPLSRAYAIPKDDPSRAEALEAAAKSAVVPPLETMRACCVAVRLAEELLDSGSAMLMSDVACSAYLCKAALESAAANVFVNTASLADAAFAEEVDAECDAMLREWAPRAQKAGDAAMRKVRRSHG